MSQSEAHLTQAGVCALAAVVTGSRALSALVEKVGREGR